MKKLILFLLPITLFVNACSLIQPNKEEYDECADYESFTTHPVTTESLEINCHCEEDLSDFSQKLAKYTEVKNFSFVCGDEMAALFDDIPPMPTVTNLYSTIISDNISVAFPNVKTFETCPNPQNVEALMNLEHLKVLKSTDLLNFPDELGNITLETFELAYDVSELPNNLGALSNVTYLEIESFNPNYEFPNNLNNLLSLKSLHLRGSCNFAPVLKQLVGLQNLKEIEMTAVKEIDDINDEFENFDSLETLIFTAAEVLSLENQKKIFKTPNLKTLIISGAYPSEIAAEISQLSNLEYLSFRGSTASNINLPNSLGTLPKLKTFIFENNLTEFPEELIGLENSLEVLKLLHGELTTIPSEIGNFTNLREINFYSNELSTLPAEIQNLASTLEYLNIQQNNFEDSTRQQIRTWLPNTQIW